MLLLILFIIDLHVSLKVVIILVHDVDVVFNIWGFLGSYFYVVPCNYSYIFNTYMVICVTRMLSKCIIYTHSGEWYLHCIPSILFVTNTLCHWHKLFHMGMYYHTHYFKYFFDSTIPPIWYLEGWSQPCFHFFYRPL